MTQSTAVSQHELLEMPEIYEFQFMPSDVQSKYTDILANVRVGEVFDAFTEYVGNNIEPIGWKAIWKPRQVDNFPKDTSFRVDVIDVYYTTLEASVIVLDLIHPHITKLTSDEHHRIQSMVEQSKCFTVPLITLYVEASPDKSDDYYNTAYIIELVRFFYRHIWRPWDDVEERNLLEDFISTRLMPRLTLIFDMQNGILSPGFITRYDAILKEANDIKEKMQSLTNSANKSDDDCTAGDYATELEATEFLRYKVKLQDLEREMNMIEDHHLRALYHTLMPDSALQTTENKYESPFVHLVTDGFMTFCTLNEFMSKVNLLLEKQNRTDWPVKLHQSLQKAIQVSRTGDAIYLMSGIYSEPLAWIEHSVEINGVGQTELDSHQDCGDVFLFCNCTDSTITLSNITIKASHQVNHLVVVKSGTLILDNCILDCSNFTQISPVLVLPNGSLIKRNYTTLINSTHSDSDC